MNPLNREYRQLNDDLVIELRNLLRTNPDKSYSALAKEYGVNVFTLEKALTGITYSHVNDNAAPVRRNFRVLKDADIIRIRKALANGEKINVPQEAVKIGCNRDTLEKAIRGETYNHLDKFAEPVLRVVAKTKEQQQARELYIAGATYGEISSKLNVSKSSVSLWCRDLAVVRNKQRLEARQLAREKAAEARRKVAETKPVRKTVTRRRTLKEEDVIFIRQDMRAKGHRNLAYYATAFKVSAPTIADAAIGRTFKQVDHIEPPVIGKMPIKKKHAERDSAYEAMLGELLVLRREDPIKWVYAELAKIASAKMGTNYQASTVARTLRNRDPSLRAFDKLHPVTFPSKAERAAKAKGQGPAVKYDLTCTWCESEFQSFNKKAELCSEKCRAEAREYDQVG